MKKKIVALCLVLALALTAIGGATLAYFTDTDEVKNEFTMGKVNIDLFEHDENGEKVNGIVYTDPMTPGHAFPKDPTISIEDGSMESYLFLDMSFNKFSSLFWVMAADASADDSIGFTIFDGDGALKTEFKNDKGVFSTTKFVAYMQTHKDVFQPMINKWFKGITHEDWEVKAIITEDTYMTVRLAYKETVKAGDTIQFMKSFGMPDSVTQEMIENGVEVGKMANAFNTKEEPFHLNFKAYAIQKDTLTAAEAYAALFPTT